MLLIGFSTSKAWYSRVIRWCTKSKVSHTFLIASVYGRPMVFQEGVLGYSVRDLKGFKDDNQIVALVLPKWDLTKGFRKSLDQMGQPYAYFGVLGMFFVILGRHLGKHIKNPFTSAHATFCSQRNTEVLQDSGYPDSKSLVADSTSPEDLLEFLKKPVKRGA